ncbi:MerR family transcriptional regulator [Halodesulfovibrio aestuarii]|uniref:MerR family transcriptional regulator n=1 Tax=Halodesulfovibrio aestuarii TaxID=126333 RepID=A0ABV4JQB0_9BACT
MYTVGRLAKKFGLSRSTLLYYDSIGLLSPAHHTKGAYRQYSEDDAEKLRRICMYRETGISLKNITQILASETTSETAAVLENRLQELSNEIATMQNQQRIVADLLQKSALPTTPMNTDTWTTMFKEAGLSTEEMRCWHESFERMSPKEHVQFLKKLHMPEKEISMIRSWAGAPQSILKLQQQSEEFMTTFFRFYEGLNRKGPGSYSETLQALQICTNLPSKPKILDIGCGSGNNAVDLAKMSFGTITAMDIYEPYLHETRANAIAAGVSNRIITQKGDMAKLPFKTGQFDIIWSEGASYIMGFDAALTYWKQFIKPQGYLVISEAVWLKEDNTEELQNFWKEAYPAMRNSKKNINAIKEKGYTLLENFVIADSNWDIFYDALELHVKNLPSELLKEAYAEDILELIHREIQLYRRYRGHYGYEFYVMQTP